MKKAVLVAGCIVLLVLVPSVVLAEKEPEVEAGLIGENVCWMDVPGYQFETWADAYWAYYSSNNVEILKCVAQLPNNITPPSERVVIENDFPLSYCRTTTPIVAYTNIYKYVIEPDGEVKVICKFNLP